MRFSGEMGNPMPLRQNADKSFQGSIVLGKGFVLTTEQAAALIAKDIRNKEVLFPYLNGDDLNNNPEQRASRWIINFFDWPEDKARSYPDCFEIVNRLVRPERQRWKLDKNGNEIEGTYALRKPLPQKWWIYAEKRPALYKTISKLDQVIVVPLVSKYSCFEFTSKEYVYMHKLGVIAFDDFLNFGILSSTFHNLWCWKNSSTLGAGTLNYSTTDCFETFPFPSNGDKNKLKAISERYYLFRKDVQASSQIGLTKIYNLFHSKDLSIDQVSRITKQEEVASEKIYSDIIMLRDIHTQLDRAVIESYDWGDLCLQHNFYPLDYLPENDRIRFTIHPEAQREVLKRLFKLNHQIYNTELKLNDKKGGRATLLPDNSIPRLF